MRHLDVVMHMNIVCVIVLGPIRLIRFHAPFAVWIAYYLDDECWMNRYTVLCSIRNEFCYCKLFDVSYSNEVILNFELLVMGWGRMGKIREAFPFNKFPQLEVLVGPHITKQNTNYRGQYLCTPATCTHHEVRLAIFFTCTDFSFAVLKNKHKEFH